MNRQRIGTVLFLLISGGGLAARDAITDTQWIGVLWLSWIPLLVAIWPSFPDSVPHINQFAVRFGFVFLSIMTLAAVQLVRVQVVMSDSIIHRVGIDPETGEVVSNPQLAEEAL